MRQLDTPIVRSRWGRDHAWEAALIAELGDDPDLTTLADELLDRLLAIDVSEPEALSEAGLLADEVAYALEQLRWSHRARVGERLGSRGSELVELFDRWCRATPTLPGNDGADVAVERLAHLLHAAVAGQELVAGGFSISIEDLLARKELVGAYALRALYLSGQARRRRLASLVARAGTSGFASRWIVFRWFRHLLYDEPANDALVRAGTVVARAAATWPTMVYDEFLDQAVLGDHAVEVRRSPHRRAVLVALLGTDHTSSNHVALTELLTSADIPPPALPAAEPDPGLVGSLGLRLALLHALRRQGVLPELDPISWVSAYEARDIDLIDEGYDEAVPELLHVATVPALTRERLAQLVRLELFDGGPSPEAIAQVMPNYDTDDPQPYPIVDLGGLEHCTSLRELHLEACQDWEIGLDRLLGLPLTSVTGSWPPSSAEVMAALSARGAAVTPS